MDQIPLRVVSGNQNQLSHKYMMLVYEKGPVVLVTINEQVLFVLFFPGTLLPRLPSEPGMSLLTIKIEKIGLKDAGQCIDPYMTISVKGKRG